MFLLNCANFTLPLFCTSTSVDYEGFEPTRHFQHVPLYIRNLGKNVKNLENKNGQSLITMFLPICSILPEHEKCILQNISVLEVQEQQFSNNLSIFQIFDQISDVKWNMLAMMMRTLHNLVRTFFEIV
jgi:hypothetical protein